MNCEQMKMETLIEINLKFLEKHLITRGGWGIFKTQKVGI